jgi:hypothetical protein
MTKLLYNPTTDTISRYPRADDEPVVGLDPSMVVLTEILPEQPSYDAETHYLEQTREIDLQAGTLTRGWLIVERPPVEPMPPAPRWQEFRAALRGIPELQTLVATLAQVDPIGHLAIGVGLGQAAQGDTSTFTGVWSELLAAGLVTPELAAAVEALATTYDLPAEFVGALNPGVTDDE